MPEPGEREVARQNRVPFVRDSIEMPDPGFGHLDGVIVELELPVRPFEQQNVMVA
jgi:hypothetical protein